MTISPPLRTSLPMMIYDAKIKSVYLSAAAVAIGVIVGVALLSLLNFAAALTASAGCASSSTPSSRPTSTVQTELDHSDYDALLQTYVNAGRVRYKDWKRNPANLAQLNSYVARLGNADMTGASRTERLAFYLNAYNAITLKTILDAYPVSSIRNISGAWSRVAWRGQTSILEQYRA